MVGLHRHCVEDVLCLPLKKQLKGLWLCGGQELLMQPLSILCPRAGASVPGARVTVCLSPTTHTACWLYKGEFSVSTSPHECWDSFLPLVPSSVAIPSVATMLCHLCVLWAHLPSGRRSSALPWL